jgi:hypothetical protein
MTLFRLPLLRTLAYGLLPCGLTFAATAQLQLNDISTVVATQAQLAPLWKQHLPLRLSGQLQLGQINASCPACPQSQTLAFFNLRSDKAYRLEKISLQQRYSAYYSFPDSHVFVLLQLEQSQPAQQISDHALAAEAFRHDCQLRQKKLAISLQQQPKLALHYQTGLLAGHQLLEFSQQSLPGGELLSCSYFSLNLPESTISQLLWLRPAQDLRIRLFFSRQANSKFSTIQQFLQLQQQFIQDYQQYLPLSQPSTQALSSP